MEDARRKIQVRVDGYTRVCLTAIAALLTVLVIGLWAEAPATAPRAGAAEAPKATFGDTAAQRQEQLKAVQQTNEKLDELIRLLKTGTAKVQLVEKAPEKARGGNHAAEKANR
jgi:hypothetical protein